MPTDMFDGHRPNDPGRRGDEERWEQVRERAQEAVRRASKQGASRRTFRLLDNRALIIAGGTIGLILIVLVLYFLLGPRTSDSASKTILPQATALIAPGQAAQAGGQGATRQGSPAPSGSNDLARVLGNPPSPDQQTEKWPARVARIGLSLALAALLGAVLAFRPRKDSAGIRTHDVARTQVLTGLLAAGLMLVAAGDFVVALTIVAAAILIRVRPSAFDSREGIVILVSGGVGLASGAGRWEVAIILAAFAFAVLWVLESSQQEEPVRNVDVSIETRNVKETNEALREVFDKNRIGAEFVRLETSDPTGRTGIVHYSINVKQGASLDHIGEEIFSEDSDNVLTINWQQRRWPAVA